MLDATAVISLIRQEIQRWHSRKQTNGVVSGLDPLTVRLNSGSDVHITDRDIGVNPQVGDYVAVEDLGPGYRLHQPLVTAGTTGDTNRGDVPIGGIIMWSGAIADIHPDWRLCDGTNGTPDLRERFVLGAGTTAPNTTGGSATHGHTVNQGTHTHFSGTLETQLTGTHNHGGSTGQGSVDRQVSTVASGVGDNFAVHTHNIANSAAHQHTVSGDTGVQSYTTTPTATDDSTLPPWYSLAYIMRIV